MSGSIYLYKRCCFYCLTTFVFISCCLLVPFPNPYLCHRIERHRRSTQLKKRCRYHAMIHMIRHQNADGMVLASALIRGMIHPPGRPLFWIFSVKSQVKWKPLISVLARAMASTLQQLIRQNHRQNQEVDLLYVFILCQWLKVSINALFQATTHQQRL
jgi:hypothetical protein